MLIRNEDEKDFAAVHVVNASAFESSAEACLVDILRREVFPIVSLVAVENRAVVGHIMFSPVLLTHHSGLKIMGLGPVALLPANQGKGIGSALVRTGLERCKDLGFGAVVVLGHPLYYSRFGFLPSSQFGIDCEYDVTEESFMAIELQPGYLRDSSGTIQYHDAFKNV